MFDLVRNFFESIASVFNPQAQQSKQKTKQLPAVAEVKQPRKSVKDKAVDELTQGLKDFVVIAERLTGTRYQPIINQIAGVCHDIYERLERDEMGDLPKTHFNDLYLSNFNTLFLLLTKELAQTKADASSSTKKLPATTLPANSPRLTQMIQDALFPADVERPAHAIQVVAPVGERPRTIATVKPVHTLDLSFLQDDSLANGDYLDWHIKAQLLVKIEKSNHLMTRYAAEYAALRKEVDERLEGAKQTLAGTKDQYHTYASGQQGSVNGTLQFSGTSLRSDDDLKLLLCAKLINAGEEVEEVMEF